MRPRRDRVIRSTGLNVIGSVTITVGPEVLGCGWRQRADRSGERGQGQQKWFSRRLRG